MGTTQSSSLEARFVIPFPEREIHLTDGQGENKTEENSPRRAQQNPPQEISDWRNVVSADSRKSLKAIWKSVAERVTAAAREALEPRRRRASQDGDAKLISDYLSVMKLALLECRAGIQKAHQLPHVETTKGSAPVPRSFALASIYLHSAEYEFNEHGVTRFLRNAQESASLRISEIWNVKPFLQLLLLEQIADELGTHCAAGGHREIPAGQASGENSSRLSRLMDSLVHLSDVEWKSLFEEVCVTDQILRTDPSRVYERMDDDTRESYRAAIADLAAHSHGTEPAIARKAIALAQRAWQNHALTERARERRAHVGYYLVDAGKDALKKEIGYHPPLVARIRDSILRRPGYFYLPGIGLTAFGLILLLMIFLHVRVSRLLVCALLVLPALECAVAAINLLATRAIPPRRIPKLDFTKGIPAACATVMAVPALLTSESQVREAVRGLEIRFLANRDPNLHFALLTDLPDSDRQFDEKEALAESCCRLVRELDEKYAGEGKGRLFHFHRHRTYNPAEQLWMGWERKRGKLLDFNRFLLKREDRFPVKYGELSLLDNIRYVLTLDLDTQLPPGAGHRLVGAMAHPLNRAVIDPASGTVVEGYGILQPRVDISVQSASRSRFAAWLSGDTGFDIYTRAVSDVYQDLFGEGIFTGKGIYEVETFQQVLEGRFPRNTVLSHDLIEGLYARAGLVSDVEVIDDYPSHFNAFSRRKHRWLRGDWQILFSLWPRVPNDSGKLERNPLSPISRWKIFDNLRRSLMELSTLFLLLYGWLVLPGEAWRWTLAAIAILIFPLCFQSFLTIVTAGKAWFRGDFWKSLGGNLGLALARVFVRLAFLCQQSMLDLDAVVRATVRMNITHRKLLEWETAADAELIPYSDGLVEAYLKYALFVSVFVGALLLLLRAPSLPFAIPLIALWCLAPWVCSWLNQRQPPAASLVRAEDREMIRNVGLRTWRFFHEFSTRDENWLIPDIIQETPPLVAHRISPTNLGLLLDTRLAAHDLGFLTTPEFIRDTERTFETIVRMPKWKGHLYNWYATDTLEPVSPLFVSTVDSGNLVCSLWSLKQGCLEIINQPILRAALWEGIRDHSRLLAEVVSRDSSNRELVAAAFALKQTIEDLAPEGWIRRGGLRAVKTDAAIFLNRVLTSDVAEDVTWWAKELSTRLTNLQSMAETLAPWLDARFEELCPMTESEIRRFKERLTFAEAPGVYGELRKRLDACSKADGADADKVALHFRAALERATLVSSEIANRLTALAAAAQSMAEEMDFEFLYDRRKKMFSIGYEAGEGARSKYNYDLLASEARTAVFVAIAKGEVPHESWFRLKRSYRSYKREDVLLSWSGTIFEYLMPCLWVRAYPNTLLEHSVHAAVRAQRKFAKEQGIPWGTSESSCCQRNPDGHYRYHAFGVPGLALHRDDCTGDLVVAPYATFLALTVDAEAAVKNLQKMKELGWLSPYGFYEAADFTPRRVGNESGPEIVRNWMAHHQAMTLLAVANFLCDSAMQQRFHAEPRVAAMSRLLHEHLPGVLPYEEEMESDSGSGSIMDSLAQLVPHPGGLRDLVPKPL